MCMKKKILAVTCCCTLIPLFFSTGQNSRGGTTGAANPSVSERKNQLPISPAMAAISTRETSGTPSSVRTPGLNDKPTTTTIFSDIPDDVLKVYMQTEACLGDATAQARTDRIIKRLKTETTEDSLKNVARANDFAYPGYLPNSMLPGPLDTIHQLFANRRTMKLYAALKQETPARRHQLLAPYFHQLLKKYDAQVALFRNKGYDELVKNKDLANLLTLTGSERDDNPESMQGTQKGLRTIVLLAAILPDPLLVSEVDEAFRFPETGHAIDWNQYNPVVASWLKTNPLFPTYFICQVRFSYHKQGIDLNGLASKDFLAKNENLWKPIKLVVPNWTSRLTPYDIKAHFGAPPDMTQGTETFTFFEPATPELKSSIGMKELELVNDAYMQSEAYIKKH